MTAPDIFLSYNREDQAVAKRYADAFAAEGLNVWWDAALRSGEAYDEVTEAALRAAKAVVVLWSPRSVVSRWVRAEATIADRCKTLVPVTIEPCERPIMFELTQTAELSHWTGDAGDRAWLAFLNDVRAFVGREAAPVPIVEAPEPTPTKPGERGGAPSLAVLPFTNRSGLPEDEVFAFGMVEDLVDALSKGVNVRIISNSSTARFCRGALPDVEAMGRQLGVRYLLEGNVRRSGSDLRVTAQLVEAASGEVLWSQKFDRPLANLAALQEDLIEELAAHLGAQCYRAEMEQALKKPRDLTAWECTTRAMAAIRQFTPESIFRAIEEAAHAVAIAPDYGLAHALLADTSSMAYMYLSPDDPAEVARIRHHIDHALACDAENAAVLGHVADALNYTGQAAEGLRRARRAIAISPGHGYAHFVAGMACAMLGKSGEALAHLANFRQIEPHSPYHQYAFHWQATCFQNLGDWAAAEEANDCCLTLNPDANYATFQKAIIVHKLGRIEEARQLMIETRRREPAGTLAMWELRTARLNAANEALLAHLRALWTETDGMV
ncbi:TIR domain-containing protein [Novosphingobium aquiterrae]|uniref:TIR domain-containing protein n=1 Tax=Novosphingobium aquiterrae TaxID=624388 RepID=A0ABV6PGS4_9SPHN